MNTPSKAVQANLPVQNVDKTVGANDSQTTAVEKKVEITNPAPRSGK